MGEDEKTPGARRAAARVLVADDEPLLREGLVRFLLDAGFDVVAQVGDAETAYAAAVRLRPDVAVLDIRMPPRRADDGLELAARLDRERPEIAVLMLSQHIEARYAMALFERRTRGIGYLLKHNVSSPGVFVAGVRRVLDGGTFIDPEVVSALLDRRRLANPLDELTAREREVLALMAEGLTNAAIERRLVVSPKTVESHVRGVFAKLDLPVGLDEHRRVMAVLTYLRA